MAQYVSTKYCLQSSSRKESRFKAGITDKVYYRDENNQIREGVINLINEGSATVSISDIDSGDSKNVPTESIFVLVLDD